jgi:hypothetical protein
MELLALSLPRQNDEVSKPGVVRLIRKRQAIIHRLMFT